MNFPDRDTGLGSFYERWAIHQLVERWLGAADLRTALEGPWDGFAGMPGLHLLSLARRGVDVTVVLADAQALTRVERIYQRAGLGSRLTTVLGDRPPAKTFDAVLSFNAPPLVPDWRQALAQLAERARSHLFVAVTHPWSYGTFIRRALRLMERSPQHELFDHEATRRSVIEPELSRHGRIVERAWLDCPWWPDLFVGAGEALWSGSLRRFGVSSSTSPGYVYDQECFHSFGARPPASLSRALRRHPVFERAGPLSAVFAHHRALLLAT